MRSITPVVPRLPIAASPTPGKPRDTGASGDCEPRAASPTLLPSRRNADRAVAKGRLTPAPTCANPTSVAATTSSALQSMGWAIHRWEGHEEEGLVWLAQCQVALIRGKKRPRRASSPVPSASAGAAGNRIPAALSAPGIILSLIFPAVAALGLTAPTLGCLRSLALLRTCSPSRQSVPSRTLCSMAWQCSGSSNADLIKNLHGAEYAFC